MPKIAGPSSKKLPGPAAVAQMRMEVEMLGKDAVEGKKKKDGERGWGVYA